VHGVLLLDKPQGVSSNDALQQAKRLFRADKAGHTGTLDPLATGVLPLCFGAATKFSQAGLDADKTYQATLQLGVTTTTGDSEGEVLDRQAVQVTPAQWDACMRRFQGPLTQTPPMYSALKHEGRPLYEYARQGIEVPRESRQVVIHALSGQLSSGTVGEIVVTCSKGTYVRTLAEDIGRALGCGAHLVALRRIATAGCTEADCVSLAALGEMNEAQRDALLRPVDALIANHPLVRLASSEAARFLSGLRRRTALPDAPAVRVYGPEASAFIGSAHIRAGELIPDRLLSPVEVAQCLTQVS
jgi:tRNA pseudouridine55 synthase